jgi:hypothetical protein
MALKGTDPRGAALARYLRERATDFSMSADVTDEQHIARAGMALLDAAMLAETLQPSDERLGALSDAGRFEARADGTVVLVESAEMRAAMQRPLSQAPMTGRNILALLIDTALPY